MSERSAHLRTRPIDDATIDAATAHYAQRRTDGDVEFSSAFVFRIGGEWLAFPTSLLARVSEVQPVHSLPHRRAGTVAGLVNVGGELIVHVSLASLLGLEQGAPGGADLRGADRQVPRLVVFADANGRLATTVDEVWGVYHYDKTGVRGVPATLARAPNTYAIAMLEVEERSVGLLDAGRVMSALSIAIS